MNNDLATLIENASSASAPDRNAIIKFQKEQMEQPAFSIYSRKDGKVWHVYADGAIDGWDGDVIVVNRINTLMAISHEIGRSGR